MILLFHQRATRPRNCRLPLAILALVAVLEGREEYKIIDGNLDDNPVETMLKLIDAHPVELLGVSAMPSPQMRAAMDASREIRRLRPQVKIAWGGYFPSIYPDAALNARCLVPQCDGVWYEQLPSWEVLWDRYSMGATERQRQCVERYKIVKRA